MSASEPQFSTEYKCDEHGHRFEEDDYLDDGLPINGALCECQGMVFDRSNVKKVDYDSRFYRDYN